MTGRHLNVAQAAEYLGVGESTLNKARVSGRGPKFSKVLGRIIYRQEVLDQYVKQNELKSTAEERAA
jgi:hypothetical protein